MNAHRESRQHEYYFLTLNNGDTLDTALSKMAENKNDSTIKTFIENWYAENMTGATDYLEDTTWYGGKTFGSGGLSSKDSDYSSHFDENGISHSQDAIDTNYSGASRESDSVLPSLSEEDINNAVVFNNSDPNSIYSVANGTLKYPVGLLSNAELVMSGHGRGSYVSQTYVDNDYIWTTLTPCAFLLNGGEVCSLYGIKDYMTFPTQWPTPYPVGVRPAVSLKYDLGANSGDGSKEHPFTNLLMTEESDEDNSDEEGEEATPINPQTSDILPLAILSATALTAISYVAMRRKTMR